MYAAFGGGVGIFWDRQYIQTAIRYMPEWRTVGYRLRRSFSAKELRS